MIFIYVSVFIQKSKIKWISWSIQNFKFFCNLFLKNLVYWLYIYKILINYWRRGTAPSTALYADWFVPLLLYATTECLIHHFLFVLLFCWYFCINAVFKLFIYGNGHLPFICVFQGITIRFVKNPDLLSFRLKYSASFRKSNIFSMW